MTKRKIKPEDINYFVEKAKELEVVSPYEARSYLIIGKSLAPKNFFIQQQSYLLEKRIGNEVLAAKAFESLFQAFSGSLDSEVEDLASAAQTHHLHKGKETEEQSFLFKVFDSFSKEVQMQILIQRSGQTENPLEKCQCMLLILQLYPDILNQHGGLLDSILACDSDAYSSFRKLLVKELVPAVLQMSENIATSASRLVMLLNRCIEFYVLVGSDTDSTGGTDDVLDVSIKRWNSLYDIVDQIGSRLNWKIAPFFESSLQNSSGASVENQYQALYTALQQRHHYSVTELVYIAVVLFLRCVVTYNELAVCSTNGETARLELVEVFLPKLHTGAKPDSTLPVLITASNCASLEGNQSALLHYFSTASKIWEMFVAAKGDRIEKEFFGILYALFNLDTWPTFIAFVNDYQTYSGQHSTKNPPRNSRTHLRMASMHCRTDNLKGAVECVISAVQAIMQKPGTPPGAKPIEDNGASLAFNKPEDFSFFNDHGYTTDSKKNFVIQRRVHFISTNRSEIIAYAANIIIKALYETIETAPLGSEDRCLGHLLTMLQLEWPSPPAEKIYEKILEIIRRNGSFRYFPFFGDFVLEPDFLEQFMAIANNEPLVTLEFWTPSSSAATTGPRRMSTRGVDKGAKNEFRDSMTKQMMKNGIVDLESLIVKFLTLNKADILSCFR